MEEFVVVLLRLRLGSLLEDVADRFAVIVVAAPVQWQIVSGVRFKGIWMDTIFL